MLPAPDTERDTLTAPRVAVACAAATAALGALGILAGGTGIGPIHSLAPSQPLIAGWVGAALVLLGCGSVLLVAGAGRPAHRRGAIAAALLVAAAAGLALVALLTRSAFDLDLLARVLGLPRPAYSWATHPLAPIAVAAAAAALLWLATGRDRSVAGALALVPALSGITITFGALYGTPVFVVGGWEPLSFVAGLGGALLGSGLIAAAGPGAWPLRLMAGNSVQATLLRWFLPLIVLVVVVTDVATINFFSGISHALGSVLNSVISVIAVGVVVYYLARVIGGRLDRAERAASRLNRLYTVVTRINEAIARVRDTHALLREASRIIVENGGFDMAWAGELDPETQRVHPVAAVGNAEEFLSGIDISTENPIDQGGPAGGALRAGRAFISRNIAREKRMPVWRAHALASGFASAAAFPLATGGVFTHVYSIYAREASWFADDQVKLLENLAADLSHALDTIEEARQHDLAERQLAESESQFRALIENSSDLLTIAEATGIIRYQSPSSRALLGYEPNERVGGHIKDLVHPEDLGQVEEAIRRTLGSKEKPEPFFVRLRHKNGTWRVMECVAWDMLGIRDIAGVGIHARDVTDRYALEAQLRQAQKMEAVGQMTSGIAHDFNNLLSIIMANADLVAQTLPADAADAREELTDIRDAAQRGNVMVKELLGFSRAADLAIAPRDLTGIAEGVARMLGRILPASIEVRFDAEPGLPAAMVDQGAVEQMLLNLANNSRDAMPDGGQLTVSVRRAPAAGDSVGGDGDGAGSYACVSIVDTGIGMDVATLQRVFEPFFTTKPRGVGTGLGMAMVQGLITQHGGYVRVTSEPGRGTTVRLCFPVALEGVTSPATDEVREAVGSGGSETVLVVDDEDALRRAARRVLEKFGYAVLVAEDGAAALQLLRSRSGAVDLVFTDLVMPKLSGVGLYAEVRREFGPIRFLIASGYHSDQAPDREALPPDLPYVRKPWTVDELLAGVRRALDGEGGAAGHR